MRDDAGYRALQEQAHLLTELTQHPGWDVLVDWLEVVVARPHKFSVLNGNMKTLEEYAGVTGFLSGLKKAIDAPQDVQGMLDAERKQRIDKNEPLT